MLRTATPVRRVGMELREPTLDLVAMASGLGLAGTRVHDPSQLRAVLEAAIASGRPNLVEVLAADLPVP